jgi:uncharacterized membrane protein
MKNAKLSKVWDMLHSSYWFIPTVMAVVATVLAFTMLMLDRTGKAAILYLTNLLGITLACMLTFLIMGYSPIKRAGIALFWTLLLTGILLLPLSVSFAQLVEQTNLESSLKNALLTKTFTFGRLELLKTDINWLTNPPQVRFIVRTKVPITSKQVGRLEKLVQKEMGQPFTLIFNISQVKEVRK